MAFQSLQLVFLAFLHLLADLFAGAFPAILPAVRERFGFSLTTGVTILTFLHVAANGMQLLAGHRRGKEEKPLLLPLGMALCGTITLVGILPPGPRAPIILCAMALVTGTGIALVHPEGLRAVHRLHRLPDSVSSAVFMVGGFFGFSGGAWLASALVEGGGLRALLFILPAAPVGILGIYLLRVRLAVDGEAGPATTPRRGSETPFRSLLALAILANTGTAVIPNLLPTFLHERGFSLSFGGMSSFLFGFGGAFGALTWGLIARRTGELRCAVFALGAGTLLIAAYLPAASSGRGALPLLTAAGFAGSGAYPMIVSMARRAKGMTLGGRMAWIVGGAWGIASMVLVGAGFIADRIGVAPVMNLTWISYAAATVAALVLVRRHDPTAPSPRP